jgi:hypothetical protein
MLGVLLENGLGRLEPLLVLLGLIFGLHERPMSELASKGETTADVPAARERAWLLSPAARDSVSPLSVAFPAWNWSLDLPAKSRRARTLGAV